MKMPNLKRSSRKKGFSLFEVVLTVGVLTIIGTLVFGLFAELPPLNPGQNLPTVGRSPEPLVDGEPLNAPTIRQAVADRGSKTTISGAN